VIRTLPVETSSLITTSSLGGQCTSQTFDLDLMAINYETIGESAGRGNSFARKLDGDCGWVKDPQQSAGGTNNTPSETSDVDYDFAVTNATNCSNNGSVEVIVNGSNASSLFPLNYTLAYDADNDFVFELTDVYTNGTDATPNTLTVSNLTTGHYRLTVGSTLGCNLQTFPFTIFQCGTVLTANPNTPTSPNNPNEPRKVTDKIWPNPAKGQLNGQFNFENKGIFSYRIFNITGQLVATGEKTVVRGVNYFSIPVEQLSPGIYQLQIIERQPGSQEKKGMLFNKR